MKPGDRKTTKKNEFNRWFLAINWQESGRKWEKKKRNVRKKEKKWIRTRSRYV